VPVDAMGMLYMVAFPGIHLFIPGPADDEVVRIRAAGRKGWLSAFRDAALPKVAYGYGLRRREVAMLDLVDFGANLHAGEFGDFGICRVRFGKAPKGRRQSRAAC
jgi:site-specific recombinase XerC